MSLTRCIIPFANEWQVERHALDSDSPSRGGRPVATVRYGARCTSQGSPPARPIDYNRSRKAGPAGRPAFPVAGTMQFPMNGHRYSDTELDAYLDESLAPELLAAIEQSLREDEALRQRLARVIGRRDQGVHDVGSIWRRHRLSCPTREQLGSYLLDVLDEAHADYITFHLETIGCRYCQASLDDLKQREAAASAAVERRRRYFESSAGRLRRNDDRR